MIPTAVLCLAFVLREALGLECVSSYPNLVRRGCERGTCGHCSGLACANTTSRDGEGLMYEYLCFEDLPRGASPGCIYREGLLICLCVDGDHCNAIDPPSRVPEGGKRSENLCYDGLGRVGRPCSLATCQTCLGHVCLNRTQGKVTTYSCTALGTDRRPGCFGNATDGGCACADSDFCNSPSHPAPKMAIRRDDEDGSRPPLHPTPRGQTPTTTPTVEDGKTSSTSSLFISSLRLLICALFCTIVTTLV